MIMRSRNDRFSQVAAAQRGVALVMVLSILVIATLLGLSAMRGANLQYLMAGNLQDQVQALVNAESTLVVAKNTISTINSPTLANPTAPGNGYFLYEDNPTRAVTSYSYWNGSSSNYYTSTDGKYVIEFIGNRRRLGGSLAVNSKDATRDLFRITVYSQGSRGGARILQSLFVNKVNPQ